jgi:nicotinate-nucleotide adenylyltransferase
MARIGILGGTFNPPHMGHLVCAQEAHSRLELDVVLLMPAGQPPHKQVADEPGPAHRLELCRLATAKDDRLAVSPLEVDRPGPSYTVDTLRILHDHHPEDNLIFIAGGDMACSLPSWHRPEEILRLATFAVAERAGVDRGEIAERIGSLADNGQVEFFGMPRIDISSSEIRRRVAEDRPIRYLVPDEVAQYIARERLYRQVVRAS